MISSMYKRLQIQARIQGWAKGAHAPPEVTASHTLPPVFLELHSYA